MAVSVVAVMFFLQAAGAGFAKAAGVPLSNPAPGGIITCGKSGQTEIDPATRQTVPAMCHLCDIIAGMNVIIQYLMWLAIFVALAVFTAAGIMYIISAGGSKMIEMAKSAMKNAVIGFIVIFAAYLIIDGIVLRSLGAYPDLGIKVTSWGQFVCDPGNH